MPRPAQVLCQDLSVLYRILLSLGAFKTQELLSSIKEGAENLILGISLPRNIGVLISDSVEPGEPLWAPTGF